MERLYYYIQPEKHKMNIYAAKVVTFFSYNLPNQPTAIVIAYLFLGYNVIAALKQIFEIKGFVAIKTFVQITEEC